MVIGGTKAMEKYYTPEQIAAMLDMNIKTIQRYIREGKIRANKIGKGWRVTGHELSAFLEGNRQSGAQCIEEIKYDNNDISCSSVIDIKVKSKDEGIRIANNLNASLMNKPAEYGSSTMNIQFIEPEEKVRIMIWGNLQILAHILKTIEVYTTN